MSDGGVTTAAGQAKQGRLVELLVAGATVNEAAEKVGVSRRHAFRLISSPEARAEIARAARESARGAQLVLQRGAEEAARALVDMSTGKTKATPARVAAARGVLDFVVERAATNIDLIARRGPDAGAPGGQPDAARDRLEALIAAAQASTTDSQTVALPDKTQQLPAHGDAEAGDVAKSWSSDPPEGGS